MRRCATTLLVLGLAAAGRADEAKGGGPMADLVRGNNAFALELYGRLRERPGNLFLSPYSISTALAMTYAGARGQTADQMARALHFPLPPDRLPAAYEPLISSIHGGPEPRPYQLLVANALWGREGLEFRPEYLRVVEAHFGAGLFRVDFRSPEPARRTINAWVADKTRDKIGELIGPGALAPETLLVLTNAIYFKGDWLTPFPRSDTWDEDFHAAGPGRVRVPMMHRTGRLGYAERDGFQALELPYKGDALAMLVLLPRTTDGLAVLEGTLSLDGLDMRERRLVRVSFPRFRLEGGFALQEVLAAMGMPDAFRREADFSGMTGRREPFISAVLHKAYVDVNEQGTEAAAATGVVMRPTAAPVDRPVEFRADHPFLFLIRDRRTGSILFLGRVANPKT